MFEKLLIHHCSPTLAGLKIGNMFAYRHSGSESITSLLYRWNQTLNSENIFLTSLKNSNGSSLIYVYHKVALEILLSQDGIKQFLQKYGYFDSSLSVILEKLRNRMSDSLDFPHEVGIFLGYPIQDVIGFIENNGKNYRCSGCWKVYSDTQYATRCFESYHRCINEFTHLHNQGIRPWELLKIRKGA